MLLLLHFAHTGLVRRPIAFVLLAYSRWERSTSKVAFSILPWSRVIFALCLRYSKTTVSWQ